MGESFRIDITTGRARPVDGVSAAIEITMGRISIAMSIRSVMHTRVYERASRLRLVVKLVAIERKPSNRPDTGESWNRFDGSALSYALPVEV